MSRTRNRQKRGGKVIAIIMAAVLSLAAGGCAGAWGVGYALTGEANPLNWTSSKPDEAPFPRTVAITNDGQPMTNGCSYDMPATGFSFLSVQNLSAETLEYVADGEITLTAELSNEYLNGKFDWAADFANSFSSWAQGKVASYYVGLEPIDGGRQVKVTYLAPFAEQIVLTATLQDTESAASCTIDCLKILTLENPGTLGTDFGDTFGIESYYNYGVGTVEGDLELTFVRVEVNTSFINAFKNYLNFDLTFKPYNTSKNYSLNLETAFNGKPLLSADIEVLKYSMLIEGFDDYDQDHKDAIYYAWKRAGRDYFDGANSNILFDFGISYTYAGVEVFELQESDIYGGFITGDCYADGVSPSVTLNKNYVF